MELIEHALERGCGGEHFLAGIWADANAARAELTAPLADLDLQALSFNAGSLLRRAAGKPIRVASKFIRSKEILHAVLKQPGFAGILGFTLQEALCARHAPKIYWHCRPGSSLGIGGWKRSRRALFRH